MGEPLLIAREPLPELHPSGSIDAVYLTCFDAEFSVLALVLQYSGIRLHRADTLDKADFLLTVTNGTVLISDLLFLDGDWRDALRMVARMHPLVGSLVAADPLDSSSIGDLYDLGGCAAIWKPIDSLRAIEVIRTVDQAARDRIFFHRYPAAVPGTPARFR